MSLFTEFANTWEVYKVEQDGVDAHDCVITKEVLNGELKRYLVGYLDGAVCSVWDMISWGIDDFEWALRHCPQDLAILFDDFFDNDDSDAHLACSNRVSNWIQGPTCSSARQIRNITSVLQSWSLAHEETHTSIAYDHEFGSSTLSKGAWRGRPPGMVKRKQGISKRYLEEDGFARIVVFGDTDEDEIRLKKTKHQHFEGMAAQLYGPLDGTSYWSNQKLYPLNESFSIHPVYGGEQTNYQHPYREKVDKHFTGLKRKANFEEREKKGKKTAEFSRHSLTITIA